jgi:hypothetical protein
MTNKTVGLVSLIGGGLLLLISLLADLIGLGSYPGLNWAQLTGAAVGLVVLLIGIWLTVKGPKSE